MTAIVRTLALTMLVAAAACAAGGAVARGQGRVADPLLGACYCRTAGRLDCTGNLSERECRRRCDEALCDDWFWRERLPCWNWGYGG